MTDKRGPYTRGYDEGMADRAAGRVTTHHSSITKEERRGYRDGWHDQKALEEAFSAAIKEQRHEGQAVIAPLSMLRCSECGELLDAYGCCVLHGLIDTEAMDGYAG